MQHDHLLRFAHRSEVVHAVPLREELEVARELRGRAVRQLQVHRADALSDLRFERHAAPSPAASTWALRRLRCTSRSEMAAGVTPWMREACPTVSGRWCASFCRTSLESPRIVA